MNDCLLVVRRDYPLVDAALEWLSIWGDGRLTGTGACVFLVFDDRESALDAYRQLPKDMRGFVARGLNRSPLCDRADD